MRAVVSLVRLEVRDLASETAWDPGRFVEKEQEVLHGQRGDLRPGA